jgi:hypothetical protein
MSHSACVFFDIDMRLLWYGVRLSAGLHASDRMFQQQLSKQRILI